ncbi:MAG: dihydrolipoyl dehydrogenase [Gammaproteobacteria bacterium]|nr:dihydrolipoyl dehydrogenase [Gammaproteobacteria bacterium]
MADSYDLIVIGSGPGGYVAAIRASQLGMKTAVVERETLGGVCLNRGCIPTKALLHCAEMGRSLGRAADFGWNITGQQLDITRVVQHARDAAEKLSAGVSHLLKKNAVDVLTGHARLLGAGSIEVQHHTEATQYSSRHIVLATGARAKELASMPFSEEHVWNATDALNPVAVPERLLVVGSGAIGIEFASIYNSFGSEVSVVEIQEQILPQEDRDISTAARRSFENQGIEIFTATTFDSVNFSAAGVSLDLQTDGVDPQRRTFDKVLVAVGVTGNTEELGLEALGIKTQDGSICTDQWKATNLQGVFAIGDVAGAPWLAHKASHEAVSCIERIAGLGTAHPLETSRVPGCTYSSPQIASIGLTEAAAREAGKSVRTGKFPFAANGKAQAVGQTGGLVKTVLDADTGEILGVHMIGANVTELVNTISVAMTLECTEDYLLRTVFAHPTLSESLYESTLDALGRAVHV